jgi:hypothetical protein
MCALKKSVNQVVLESRINWLGLRQTLHNSICARMHNASLQHTTSDILRPVKASTGMCISITTPGVSSALSTDAIATSSGLKSAGAQFWCSIKPSNGSIPVCSIA